MCNVFDFSNAALMNGSASAENSSVSTSGDWEPRNLQEAISVIRNEVENSDIVTGDWRDACFAVFEHLLHK